MSDSAGQRRARKTKRRKGKKCVHRHTSIMVARRAPGYRNTQLGDPDTRIMIAGPKTACGRQGKHHVLRWDGRREGFYCTNPDCDANC